MDNMSDVIYSEYGPKGLTKEVAIESDTDVWLYIDITKFSDRPHHVFIECFDESVNRSTAIEIHKGSFVRGMYKAIKEFDQLDYFKELMEEDV